MKVLETQYNGYRFRSRLEARWAVFMDAMNVPYQYEKEAYDLDGLFYLPDFWLPQMKAHLEIKGDPMPDDWKKARRLANHSKLPVYVICDQPECPEIWNNWYQNESSATLVVADSEDLVVIANDGEPRCERALPTRKFSGDGRNDNVQLRAPPGNGRRTTSPGLARSRSSGRLRLADNFCWTGSPRRGRFDLARLGRAPQMASVPNECSHLF